MSQLLSTLNQSINQLLPSFNKESVGLVTLKIALEDAITVDRWEGDLDPALLSHMVDLLRTQQVTAVEAIAAFKPWLKSANPDFQWRAWQVLQEIIDRTPEAHIALHTELALPRNLERLVRFAQSSSHRHVKASVCDALFTWIERYPGRVWTSAYEIALRDIQSNDPLPAGSTESRPSGSSGSASWHSPQTGPSYGMPWGPPAQSYTSQQPSPMPYSLQYDQGRQQQQQLPSHPHQQHASAFNSHGPAFHNHTYHPQHTGVPTTTGGSAATVFRQPHAQPMAQHGPYSAASASSGGGGSHPLPVSTHASYGPIHSQAYTPPTPVLQPSSTAPGASNGLYPVHSAPPLSLPSVSGNSPGLGGMWGEDRGRASNPPQLSPTGSFARDGSATHAPVDPVMEEALVSSQLDQARLDVNVLLDSLDEAAAAVEAHRRGDGDYKTASQKLAKVSLLAQRCEGWKQKVQEWLSSADYPEELTVQLLETNDLLGLGLAKWEPLRMNTLDSDEANRTGGSGSSTTGAGATGIGDSAGRDVAAAVAAAVAARDAAHADTLSAQHSQFERQMAFLREQVSSVSTSAGIASLAHQAQLAAATASHAAEVAELKKQAVARIEALLLQVSELQAANQQLTSQVQQQAQMHALLAGPAGAFGTASSPSAAASTDSAAKAEWEAERSQLVASTEAQVAQRWEGEVAAARAEASAARGRAAELEAAVEGKVGELAALKAAAMALAQSTAGQVTSLEKQLQAVQLQLRKNVSHTSAPGSPKVQAQAAYEAQPSGNPFGRSDETCTAQQRAYDEPRPSGNPFARDYARMPDQPGTFHGSTSDGIRQLPPPKTQQRSKDPEAAGLLAELARSTDYAYH